MNITKSEYAAYLNNQLSEDQRKEMEVFLVDHPLERRALEGAMAFNKTDSFEELLAEVDEEVQSSNAKESQIKEIKLDNPAARSKSEDTTKIRMLMRYAIAAAAAVLMLFMLRTEFGGSSSSDLNQYIDTYPDVITNVVRGNDQEVQQSNLVEAMTAYNSGDMLKANELLVIEHKNQRDNKNIKLYLAITDLHLGNYEKSISQLEELSDVNFAYEDGALWYRAICLLQLERKEEAKELLSIIANQRHYKSAEARKLLDDLI